jgi:hypothetical protein
VFSASRHGVNFLGSLSPSETPTANQEGNPRLANIVAVSGFFDFINII